MGEGFAEPVDNEPVPDLVEGKDPEAEPSAPNDVKVPGKETPAEPDIDGDTSEPMAVTVNGVQGKEGDTFVSDGEHTTVEPAPKPEPEGD